MADVCSNLSTIQTLLPVAQRNATHLLGIPTDPVPLGHFLALDVVAILGALPVEVGPGSVASALADRGGPAALETVRAVVRGSAARHDKRETSKEEERRERVSVSGWDACANDHAYDQSQQHGKVGSSSAPTQNTCIREDTLESTQNPKIQIYRAVFASLYALTCGSGSHHCKTGVPCTRYTTLWCELRKRCTHPLIRPLTLLGRL